MTKSIEMHRPLDEDEKFKNKVRRQNTEEYARLLGEEDPNAYLVGGIVKQDIEMEHLENENRELKTDELTGLMSRKLFDETVKKFIEMIVRNHKDDSRREEGFGYTKLTILFLDVDYFKPLNDTFGHDFGDKILKGIADALKKTLRANDLISRWGGDEFVVCLLGTDEEDTKLVIEKLETAIRSAIRNFYNETEKLGPDYLSGRSPISIGYATFDGNIKENIDSVLEKLISQADQSMYVDKNNKKQVDKIIPSLA